MAFVRSACVTYHHPVAPARAGATAYLAVLQPRHARCSNCQTMWERSFRPYKEESLDGLTNKLGELKGAVATAGGNHAVSPGRYPCHNPLKAKTGGSNAVALRSAARSRRCSGGFRFSLPRGSHIGPAVRLSHASGRSGSANTAARRRQ